MQRKFKSEPDNTNGALEIFAGFRSKIGKRVYIGGEAYGGIARSKAIPYDDSASGILVGLFKVQVERRAYGGVAALFGYEIVKGTLTYARLGFERGEWTADVTPNSATITKQPDAMCAAKTHQEASNKIFTKSDNSFSLVPGFGLHTRVTKHMSLRLQCSWLFGPSINGLEQDITGYPQRVIAGTSIIHNFQISQPRLGIGLCYEG